jgi:hypothetical protein
MRGNLTAKSGIALQHSQYPMRRWRTHLSVCHAQVCRLSRRLDSGSRPRCGLGRNNVRKYTANSRNRTLADYVTFTQHVWVQEDGKGRSRQRWMEHLLFFPGIQGIAFVPRVGRLGDGCVRAQTGRLTALLHASCRPRLAARPLRQAQGRLLRFAPTFPSAGCHGNCPSWAVDHARSTHGIGTPGPVVSILDWSGSPLRWLFARPAT